MDSDVTWGAAIAGCVLALSVSAPGQGQGAPVEPGYAVRIEAVSERRLKVDGEVVREKRRDESIPRDPQ